MKGCAQRIVAIAMALALSVPAPESLHAQSPAPAQAAPVQNPQQPGSFVMKVNAELVLTNVVARDKKTGELVHGLKQSDFTVYESGKQQQIATFDFQSVDMDSPVLRLLDAWRHDFQGVQSDLLTRCAVVNRPQPRTPTKQRSALRRDASTANELARELVLRSA